mmetsp:Transcript_555/g.1327  ORF Transcript_555/g.1327 Transcript_555/m.1327 type:complete len:243 (-) Transcript_555:228-956(-)
MHQNASASASSVSVAPPLDMTKSRTATILQDPRSCRERCQARVVAMASTACCAPSCSKEASAPHERCHVAAAAASSVTAACSDAAQSQRLLSSPYSRRRCWSSPSSSAPPLTPRLRRPRKARQSCGLRSATGHPSQKARARSTSTSPELRALRAVLTKRPHAAVWPAKISFKASCARSGTSPRLHCPAVRGSSVSASQRKTSRGSMWYLVPSAAHKSTTASPAYLLTMRSRLLSFSVLRHPV